MRRLVTCTHGSLEARVRHADGRSVVVELAGALDLAAVDALGAVLDNLDDCHLISLDLEGVTFLDCAGLGAIMAHHQQLLARSGRLVLVHVPPVAQRILKQTGLQDTLTTVELAPRPQTPHSSGSPDA